MKNNNKTLKRLTATFLTAISVFNFTVPGKAEVVNFQPDKSISYGEGNDKTISAEALEEIRVKFQKQFDANINKLGREYHSVLSDYDTNNFTAKGRVTDSKSDDNKTYTGYFVDKELIFEYKDIKNVYIIYSLEGCVEKWAKGQVENDKNEGYFNQFDPEHKNSIFLVIALDGEWEKMEEIYKKEDVQNKFIRFGRIIDNYKTIPWEGPVGIKDDNGNIQFKTITANVTKREIRFIDPIQPILIYGGGIIVACLVSIPVIGPIIEQHIKNGKTKVNIKKTNTNINTHTNK